VYVDREQFDKGIACYERAAKMFHDMGAHQKAGICESNIKEIKDATTSEKTTVSGDGESGITIGPGGSLVISEDGVKIEGNVTIEGDVTFEDGGAVIGGDGEEIELEETEEVEDE